MRKWIYYYLDATLVNRGVGTLGRGKVDLCVGRKDVVRVGSFGEVPALQIVSICVNENLKKDIAIGSTYGLASLQVLVGRGKDEEHAERHCLSCAKW